MSGFSDTLVAGPGANVGLRVRIDACWARTGGTTDFPVICGEETDPDGLGLCDHHLSLYREEP